MKTYKLEITLDDDQQNFLENLAEHDGNSTTEELRMLCLLQLREEIELMKDEG